MAEDSFRRTKARSPHAARKRYTDFFQKSLSSISPSVWQVGPSVGGASEEWSLFLPEHRPLRLRGSRGDVWLTAGQRFVVIEDTDHPGEFRTSTRHYIYSVAEDPKSPTIEWHWHPDTGQREPHLHVRPRGQVWGQQWRKLHMPTERVPFELVVLFLIEDLEVTPKRATWQAEIDEALRAFRRFRTWPFREGLQAGPAEAPIAEAPPARRGTRPSR